jgi:hypothetical protein
MKKKMVVLWMVLVMIIVSIGGCFIELDRGGREGGHGSHGGHGGYYRR